jgi:hypothetical protein
MSKLASVIAGLEMGRFIPEILARMRTGGEPHRTQRGMRASGRAHDGTIVPVRAGASTPLAEGIDFDEGQQRMVLPFVT